MTEKLSYKTLRAKLDDILAKLELSETSDVDELLTLHKQALGLIDELEALLAQAAKEVKKIK